VSARSRYRYGARRSWLRARAAPWALLALLVLVKLTAAGVLRFELLPLFPPAAAGGAHGAHSAHGHGRQATAPPPPLTPGPGVPSPAAAPSATARADIPPAYLAAYRQATARWCPRLPWAVLAGVGRVESDHGRANLPGVRSGVNAAGCCAGPMQFNLHDGPPSTWATYGAGGDVYDYRDAIPAAARKLCADGATRPGGLVGAVAAYYGTTVANPPTAAYVTAVLGWAARYGDQAAGGGG